MGRRAVPTERAVHGDRQVAPVAPAVTTVAPSSRSASWSGAIGLRRSGGRPSIVHGAGTERRQRGEEPRRRAGQAASTACTALDPGRPSTPSADHDVVVRRVRDPSAERRGGRRASPPCRRRAARRRTVDRPAPARRRPAPGWRCSSTPGRGPSQTRGPSTRGTVRDTISSTAGPLAGSPERSGRRGRDRQSTRRRGRRRRRGCPRRCAPPRSWRC